MSLFEEQLSLEKEVAEKGYYRYFSQLHSTGFSNSLPCSKIEQRVIDILIKNIEEYLDKSSSEQVVRKPIVYKLIKELPVKETACVAIKVIMDNITKGVRYNTLCGRIGRELMYQKQLKMMKHHNLSYYNKIMEDLNSRQARPDWKREVIKHIFEDKLQFHTFEWLEDEKAKVGCFLLELFHKTTGLIEFDIIQKKKKGNYKRIKFVKPKQEMLDWIDKFNERAAVANPFYLPMVYKPKEWTGIFDGGYYTPYLPQNKLIKNDDKEYLSELENHSMPEVYKAINSIQNVEWRTNTEVLDIVKDLWDGNYGIGGLPNRENLPIKPFPEHLKEKNNKDFNQKEKEEFKNWKTEANQIYRSNVSIRSKRYLSAQIISIAEKFRDKVIYFPHQMDFRGRLYPIPVLFHPQGNDLAKGLLTFAKGKPITTETQANWLRVHGANCFGIDKVSFEDRVKWVKDNEKEIKDYAKNPTENIGWSKADKPIQFLAFCLDYSKYLNSGYGYVSSLPIALDATCSGLQHYSALLRDRTAGVGVNLVDSQVPQDIYSVVAEKVKEKLLVDVNTKFDDGIDRQLLLQLGVNRKLTKRSVMTLPYGLCKRSSEKYVGDYYKENFNVNYLAEEFNQEPSRVFFKIAHVMNEYVWEAIEETLTSAIRGMAYLKSVSRLIDGDIRWVSPIGLLISQSYKNLRKIRVNTEVLGSIFRMNVLKESPEISKKRQAQGICPNIVHSIDASHLMKWINTMNEAGITQLSAVHDSFATTAADAEISQYYIRETFIDIYKEEVLENLVKGMLGTNDIPEVPMIDTLNIEEVRDSRYFFS